MSSTIVAVQVTNRSCYRQPGITHTSCRVKALQRQCKFRHCKSGTEKQNWTNMDAYQQLKGMKETKEIFSNTLWENKQQKSLGCHWTHKIPLQLHLRLFLYKWAIQSSEKGWDPTSSSGIKAHSWPFCSVLVRLFTRKDIHGISPIQSWHSHLFQNYNWSLWLHLLFMFH